MNKLYVTEDWTFDPSTLTLKYATALPDEAIDPKTSLLLQFLLNNQNTVVSREEIYNELYGIENARADGTITAYVSKLRKLLEAKINAKGKYIRTVPKAGYQFIGNVSVKEIRTLADVSATRGVDEQADSTPYRDILARPKHEGANAARFSFKQMAFIFTLLIVLTAWLSSRYIQNSTQDRGQLGPHEWSLIHQDVTQNNSVALSPDGLYLTFIIQSNDRYSLVIKDTFSPNQRVVYRSENEAISAPVFAPSGAEVAFMLNKDGQCQIKTLVLDEGGFQITDKSKNIEGCGVWNTRLKMAYLDNNTLIYSQQDSNAKNHSIIALDLTTNKKTQLVDTPKDGLGDYTFSVNSDTQQLALLREEGNEKTGVFIFNINENTLSHIITVNAQLQSLEWLNNNKLIVMNGRKLELIDILQKDIRPTSLVKLKDELEDELYRSL
ncbi:winged helix-turn-helix domain-containing protein [Psychrosphaera aestuarii]|uniref:winged helix-turn-helix domain-containing protein n=1 Tax=Psychrosphaera aestuarii TaxID=1266052 RepID=UPI001B31AC11|nr:winged helix-turn-helix domain-containing protein [Psychrosphaera aestuarii]